LAGIGAALAVVAGALAGSAVPAAAGPPGRADPSADAPPGPATTGEPSNDAPPGWSSAAALPATFAPRWDFSVAYLPTTQQVVLFGGAPAAAGDPWFNEVWLYKDGVWTQGAAPPDGLTPRGGAAMAYDPDIGQIVLFGGEGSDWPPDDDTWLFDGTTWTPGPPAPAGLAGRVGARMVYDPDIDELVLFGGGGTSVFRDTWLFDGSAWTQGPAAPSGMSGRENFGMSYNPSLHDVVVAGGDGDTDTWLFDGTSWSAGPDMGGQGPRETFMMDDDPTPGDDYLFGGFGAGSAQSTILKFDGDGWSKVTGLSKPKPSARVDAGWLWYPPRSAFMLINGMKATAAGDQGYVESWWFNPTGTSESDVRSTRSKMRASGPATAAPVAPADATAPITAHDGQFWAGGQPITLKGAMQGVQSGTSQQTTLDGMGAWGMNVVRLTFRWCDLEPNAPQLRPSGVWKHTYDSDWLAVIQQNVEWAQAAGLYSVVALYGGDCSYFQYPGWLFDSPYNSHGLTYDETPAGKSLAQANWWTDVLQQQFWKSMWKWVAANLKGTPGLAGYEVMNEPWKGDLPNKGATDILTLDGQLGVAKAIRTRDPDTTIFFTTRAGYGPGIPGANLTSWSSIGNVAFDLHDYFGARWGDGVNENPDGLSYRECMQVLFAITTSSTMTPPSYIGNTVNQVRFIDRVKSALAGYGIPLMVGEFGDDDGNLGAYQFYGTTTAALTYEGVSWAVDYGDNHGITDGQGNLEPWGWIVIDAL
jgi:hypothetical protein